MQHEPAPADLPAVVMPEPASDLTIEEVEARLDAMRDAGTLPPLRHRNPPDVEALYLHLDAAKQLAEKIVSDLEEHECPGRHCDGCAWEDAAQETSMFLNLFASHVGDTLYGTGWRIEHLTPRVRQLVEGLLLAHHGVDGSAD